MEIALITSCVLLICTNVFWAVQLHRLINKVMAGDYQNYQIAKAPLPKPAPRVELPPDPPEDLGILSGFQVS